MYCYTEKEFKYSVENCPYLSKCIVCSEPYITSYEKYMLRSIYSKFKRSIKWLNGPEVLQISK